MLPAGQWQPCNETVNEGLRAEKAKAERQRPTKAPQERANGKPQTAKTKTRKKMREKSSSRGKKGYRHVCARSSLRLRRSPFFLIFWNLFGENNDPSARIKPLGKGRGGKQSLEPKVFWPGDFHGGARVSRLASQRKNRT